MLINKHTHTHKHFNAFIIRNLNFPEEVFIKISLASKIVVLYVQRVQCVIACETVLWFNRFNFYLLIAKKVSTILFIFCIHRH